jgi:spore germination protein KC
MRLKFVLAALLIITTVGCWDIEEVNNRAFIIDLGLDRASDNRIKVIMKLPIMENIMAPTTGAIGEANKTHYLLSSESTSVLQAVSDIQTRASGTLFGGQIRTIIISAALAETGLKPHLDALTRRTESPPQAFVALTEETTEDILGATLVPSAMAPFTIMRFFHSSQTKDQTFPVNLWRFKHRIDSLTEEPEEGYLPIISYDPEQKSYIIKGLGVFHDDHLVGKLSGPEARMFGLFTGRATAATIQIGLEQNQLLTYRTVTARNHITATFKDGRVNFLCNIKAEGNLGEMADPEFPLSNRRTRQFESVTASAIEKQMNTMVRRLQEVNSDVLDLGELLRSRYPRVWSQVDWDVDFPQADIKIQVHFLIKRTGILR